MDVRVTISNKYHAEDAASPASNTVEEANLQTIDAALVGQITSGLRHELGNALTVIRLNLSLLEHYRTDEAKFARHMNSLKEGLLGVERVLHATRYFPTPELDTTPLIDLGDILRECLDYVNQELQQSVQID